MKQLNEKVAVVTGAGQGIGKGIAAVASSPSRPPSPRSASSAARASP